MNENNVYYFEMTKALSAMMLIEEKEDLFRKRKVFIQILARPSLHTTVY